ncbi:MAG TPA: DUF6311 domain-containing protein [Vicinamibacterales bacterium]|nr:DUF6311 domain-containing protein [Vicinamibacterales bacterium]
MRNLLARRSAPLVVGLGFGVLYAWILVGTGPLKPSNTAWIFGDTATYYVGWEEYRHDPHLHFPLSWTERVGYPIGTSIALLDAIPLAAVLLRPFSPLLPEPFQYLGLWMLLSLVLQAYFAFSLCRRLFVGDALFALLASVFLLVSAPLVYRICTHVALTSHWLILAALDAYFIDPAGHPVRWLARGWAVAAAAAAINPYMAAMCLLVVIGSVARLAVERHCQWKQAAVLAVATVAIVLASGAVAGAVVIADSTAYWAPGYGSFSMNLNAPFNPVAAPFPCCTAHAAAGSILLPSLPFAQPEQYEGYSYLGLGTIALLAVFLASRPASVLWIVERRLIALTAVAVACTVLAASGRVTFGAHTLIVVHWPAQIDRVLQGLRASGRLFWPAYYLIVLSAVSLVYWIARPNRRVVALSVALIVQFADLAPLHAETRGVCEARFENLLRSPEWNGLGRRYENLIMIPAYQCDPYAAAGGPFNYVYFGKLAAIEQMRTNNYYAARYTHAELYAHCVDLLRTQLQGNLDPHSAYVVDDRVRDVWAVHGLHSRRCQQADGNNLCVATDSPATDPPLRPRPAAPYVLGTVIDFSRQDSVRPYLTFGWTYESPEGTWTDGPLAMLRLGADPTFAATHALDLDVDALPLLAPRHPRLDVEVIVNGESVATWIYDRSSPLRQSVRIPVSAASARREIDIEFQIRNPESPQYLGVGPMPKFLGLNLRSIVVRRVVS